MVASLFNIFCRSELKIAQNNGIACKRMPSCDEISLLKRELGKKIYDDMSVTLGDKRPSYFTVKTWIARFRTEHLSTEEEEERSGRSTQESIPENMDAVHSMIWTMEEYPLNI
jgi:hypothetical protein